MRRLLRRLGFTALIVLTITPIVIEVGVRIWDPTPRRMVIRPGPDLLVERVQGTPLWWVASDAERLREPDCEGDKRVLIVGDSIMKGWGVPLEESWSILWREASRDSGVCVHNYASPGYGHAEEWALTQEYVPQLKPDVLVYEVYTMAHPDSSLVQHMVGDSIFDLRGLEVGEDGAPRVFPVPDFLNLFLFANSQAYQYVNVSSGDPFATAGAYVPELGAPTLERVARFGKEHGIQVVFVLCHRLDTPFDEHVANRPPRLQFADRVARKYSNVHVVDTAELLVGEQLQSVALDACCHFNGRGQRVLAERLGPAIEAYIPGQEPAGDIP
ncbi:MAG: SGNH/GDSL hydrolase family protein [Proteobacteria bacterium]|nr:SGNH/GDSL hydrolase family protein [Pseudomonadota bacterium]MCP4919316.1 SGNH/GDSL hydrolase family protein [Pseudomonadota bacterium]